LDQFASEAENIRAGWSWANLQAYNNEKAAEICWSYTTAGGNLLLNRLPPSELRIWSLRSLAIATRLFNPDAELNPITLLGLVDESVGEYDSAEAYFRRGASLAQSLGDNRNAAFLLQHLGRVLGKRGHTYDGIDNYERARQLLCDMGEHDTELKLVSDIALALAELRENHQAVDYLQKVLENARRTRNRLEEANALANLSTVWKNNSRPQAIRWSDEAAEIFQELGYRHWQAQALLQSGLLRVGTDESETGIEQIKFAHMIYRDIGDGNGEARAVGTLGEAYRSLDRNEEAIEAFETQLRVARRIGDRHREINALGDKGVTLAKMGSYELAIVILKEAREVARSSGNDEQEFNTLCNIGKAYIAIGKTDEAITIFEEQVEIGKKMGLVSKQLHAFKHIADVYRDRGALADATKSMKSRVNFAETSRDHHDYPSAMFELSQFLFSVGQHHEAITTAEAAQALFEQRNDPSCAYKVQSQIEEWKGGVS
jgi:tetratricopeptide (TPR) repeat protein